MRLLAQLFEYHSSTTSALRWTAKLQAGPRDLSGNVSGSIHWSSALACVSHWIATSGKSIRQSAGCSATCVTIGSDSAKWHNVNMYCEKRDVSGFYGPTSNASSRMENIVSAQGTSSSTSGGTLLLMTNIVAGHMCQMPQHQTVGKQLHLSFDFMESTLILLCCME